MRRFPLAGNGVHRTVAGTLGTTLTLVRINLVYTHGFTYVSRALLVYDVLDILVPEVLNGT